MADAHYIARGHKIGVHAQKRTPELFQHIDRAVAQGTPFPVIKFVDELTALQAVKERSPSTITIGRRIGRMDGLEGIGGIDDGDVSEWVQAIMQPIFDYFALNPGLEQFVDYVEFLNEADPPTRRGYEMMGKVVKACVQLGRQQLPGVGWAIGSFNAGTPEYDEMQAFLDSGVLTDAHGHGDVILAYHEGVFANDPIDHGHGAQIPGAPSVPEGGGAMVGRVAYWAQLAGSEMIPAVATEFYYGGSYDDHEGIRERAAWVDDVMSDLWYVLAVLPFTHAPVGQWVGTQDYTPAYPGLLSYAATVRERQNAAPEPQEPDPGPDEETLQQFIWRQSRERDTINEEAALYKALRRAGYMPYSTEFRREFAGETYAIQTGFDRQSGKRVVAYVRVPEWGDVKIVEGDGT